MAGLLRIEEVLPASGCKLSKSDFQLSVLNLFRLVHKDQTYEWLARRPTIGAAFCREVCKSLSAEIPEEAIMGALENLRKQGFMTTGARKKKTVSS